MISNGMYQSEQLIDIIRHQIEYLLAMIVRPVVQQQLLVMLLVLVIVWLVPELWRRWRQAVRIARDYPLAD